MRKLVVAVSLAWVMGCTGEEPPEEVITPPEPGPLLAGLAERRIPAPVGIGTAGFGAIGADPNPTPFAELYPGTRHVWGHPDVEVMALSRGEGFEAVFVRIDAVAVFSQLRYAIVEEVSRRVGRDMDDAIILGATHTHSGAGRLVNSGSSESSFFDLIADKFHAEYYERFVDAVAGAIVDALDDLQPARLGSTVTDASEAHKDRRCEDGEDYSNGSLPLLVVEREGQVDAVLMSYAIHGTGLGLDDLHLSADVSGAIEQVTEDAFDHPVQVMQFNSWGGDMSPGDPEVETRETADRDNTYVDLLRVGQAVADATHAALEGMVFDDAPTIDIAIHRTTINREAIGYDDDTFPYPFGGVYCGLGSDACEPPRQRDDALDRRCVPFSEEFPAPSQTDITVGRVGDFALVTFPGEPGTRLVEGLLSQLREEHEDVDDILFLGYSQDYLAYALEEEDWWFGGYEASGGMWGPQQGEYLRAEVARLYRVWAGSEAASEEPGPLIPFAHAIDTPYEPEDAVAPGTILSEPVSSVAANEAVTFTVAGEDPWLGVPEIGLEMVGGDPVLRPSGKALTGDDLDFDITLVVDPPYETSDGDIVRRERTFSWTVRLAPRSPLLGGLDLTGGSYQFVATVPRRDGSETVLTSGPFDITAAD